MNLIIDFSSGEQLAYTLKDTPVVSNWANILRTTPINAVASIASQHNSKHGFSTPNVFREKYEELRAIGKNRDGVQRHSNGYRLLSFGNVEQCRRI